jgi:D-arabinose 1-dehydrogenase-like Zn-dependent alcohol dehydrogenase
VDHIIEVGGSGTLQQSFRCVKYEGVISVIGFIGGVDPKTQPTVLETLTHICTVRGVYVGSKAQMRDMVRAIEANDIHPVVDDKIFSLHQTREAYDYMVSWSYLMATAHTLIKRVIVGSKAFRQVDDQDHLRSLTQIYQGQIQQMEILTNG